MNKLNILKPLILALPLALAGCGQPTPNAVTIPTKCKNKPLSIIITADLQGNTLTTSVEPYTLVVSDPNDQGGSNRTSGNQHIYICLVGNADFVDTDSIKWKNNRNDEFEVAKKGNGKPDKDKKYIVIKDKNSIKDIFLYLAVVEFDDGNGGKIKIEIDPRIDNKGGGHTKN